ncbi:MAG TPA: hypothetical protein DGF10_09845 [Acidimicrobiaceae bacterium]|mgnify:FL=1|nr:hypothetical protein [Acidimicrobiaceae bacterium]HCV34954.1 hypothetical protein [Acidimicrobiaceae bacterium]|tara:strand:- start:472 stop:1482 length:1011 start_codon:yes stop_codon:yes gene_type:complete
MEALVMLAGLAWDPEIRGILTVVTGFVVLMGSIWLIVATNSGIRLATLMSAAALMGWMVILGSAWWMYGSGWKGDAPSWKTIDINVGDLGASGLMEARLLPNSDEMPTAYELVVASGDPTAISEFNTLPTAGENPDLSADELTALQADRQLRNEIITRSELAAVARNVTDDAGLRELGPWRLLATTEAGDAQAQAAADVLAHPDLGFVSSADYKLLDAYTMGGKPALQDDPNRWDRIRHWITNSARITHPTRYTVVQLQGVLDQEVAPGEAPPRPVVDPEEPVVSVVMVRDLGWVRLRPALVTIGSLLVFLALCYWLHVRDRELMERRREFESSKA